MNGVVLLLGKRRPLSERARKGRISKAGSQARTMGGKRAGVATWVLRGDGAA